MTIFLILLNVIFFVCLILVIFAKKRPDGHIVVKIDTFGKKIFSLELDKGPEQIEKMKNVHFKVVSENEDESVK